jgi:nitrite reductase/ring-hydroxylating ferredoxin subunit
MAWHKALPVAALPVGAHTRVELDGQPILLSHLEDGFHAVHDTCLHRGASLAAGPMAQGLITCHLHFWSFDARSGACTQVPGLALKAFNVKIEEGEVHVEV